MNSDDVEVRTERTEAAVPADGSDDGNHRAGRAYRGQGPAASTYGAALPAIALVGGACAFGACGLSLALLGLGMPFAVAAMLAGASAGVLIYALGRWALARAAARVRE